MANKIPAMPINAPIKALTEAHPLLLSKVIRGDLREKTWISEGVTHTAQNTDGELLYDRDEKRNRPWFVLVYESGKRIVD